MKPNRLLAALLCLLAVPLGPLYLARPRLAVSYFLLTLLAGGIELYLATIGKSIGVGSLPSFIAAAHCFSLAKHQWPAARPWYSRRDALVCVAIAIVGVFFLMRVFFVETFRIPTQSMFPSMPVNSVAFVDKFGFGNYATFGIRVARTDPTRRVGRGDVVVFELPTDRNITYIKRVIGLPGDRIQIVQGDLTVNGTVVQTASIGRNNMIEVLKESNYLIARDGSKPLADLDVQVAPDTLFVLSDNRNSTHDSRTWGLLPIDHLIGRAWHVFAPDWRDVQLP